MKLKFALLLSMLMVAFISTHAFAEDKNYKQAKLDWHNAIEAFMQKVKVAEGFDYHASKNSNLWTALDVEVKRLANEEENTNKDYYFFLCKAHKKVMRQFHSASYDLVKLGSTCSSSGLVAENWVSTGKNDRGEYFRDIASIKSEGDFVVVKDKIIFAEQQNNDSLIYQIRITDYAIDCNAKTAASISYSYQSLGGEVITAFEIPRSKWSFDNEGYKALGMAGVCILSGTPTTLSKLESLKIAANGGDAVAQFNLGMSFLTGDGVHKDAFRAEEWLQKAAEQDLMEAQYFLGMMHYSGDGIPKDLRKALVWLQRAAEKNHISALTTLAWVYKKGEGVPKNEGAAFELTLRAAAQGDGGSQFLVSADYLEGAGTIKDMVRAYAWFNLAAAQDSKYRKHRDYIERKLTPTERTEGSRLASRWTKGDTLLNDHTGPADSPREDNKGTQPKLASTGSGFMVNTNGALLTNHHVINGCANLRIRDFSKNEQDVILVATDARNDLALLQIVKSVSLPAATFRASSSVEAGENVVALGYPLAGVLASEVNVSFGYVSATAGLADDTSKLQISAPVQPGNSGGPLLDQAGNLIGVVVAKLDALKVAKAIGDIPQNINFAVKGEIAQVFLKAHKVKFKTATATKKLENTDIASRGRAFTVLVECYK